MQESQRHGISRYDADPVILAKKHDSVLQGLGNQVGRFEVLAATSTGMQNEYGVWQSLLNPSSSPFLVIRARNLTNLIRAFSLLNPSDFTWAPWTLTNKPCREQVYPDVYAPQKMPKSKL